MVRFHPLVNSHDRRRKILILSSVISHLVRNVKRIFWNVAKIHNEISFRSWWKFAKFYEILLMRSY